jgi:HAD superfamily hydrolase (TIGR01509 family)
MISSTEKIILNVRAVIFDMDGVITNTMPDHFHAWKSVLNDEGISVTQHDVYSREGQRGITSLQEIFATYQRPYHQDRASAILKKKEELFKQIVRQRFISGSRTFLKSLKRSGFVLALVTGTSRHELHRILPDDIFKLFNVVVTGSDVVNGKPDPEPYRLALAKLRLNPSHAVVIENAPLGIKSAKAAGLRCLALETSLPQPYLKSADAIFTSIRDLREQVIFVMAPSAADQ